MLRGVSDESKRGPEEEAAHLPFLSDRQRVNVRRIEGDYLSQRRVSLYIREDYIRQRMPNTITETLLRFMPDGMMEEQIVKYGIKL